MSISSSELESILAERLDLVRKEKTTVRASIEELETKIKNARKLMVNPPRETDEELAAYMQKLEHSHATTPQNNTEEREFMREMDKVRQKRKAVAAYVKVKAEVDDLRSRLTELRKVQAEKEDSITELHQGLRKVKVANKSGCNNSEISERKFTVETSKVARIVGRGGSNLRFIEAEHAVSIEIDNNGGEVRVMGTDEAIQSALGAIMTIVETSIEEFSLSDETIVCLMMDKAQRVNEIQAQYSVRLDVSRAKNLCKVTGLTDNVTAARAYIASLQTVRTDMLMETSALSAIIGKGGASVIALQEEFGVSINVNRDRSTVEVVGMRNDVSAALAKIKDIVETNREVEEVIKLEKHVLLGCLMGAGGHVMRGIQKDFNVRVDAENVKDSALQTIKIKGTHGKVSQAKAHVVHLVGEFLSNSLVIEVPDDVIPAILGKGGSGIKAFREKYAGANIDIDGPNVHIQSSSAEVRAAIKAEIDAILEANYSQLIECTEDLKQQLRSAQGVDTRNAVTKDLSVRLVLDASPTALKIRGNKADVLKAAVILEEFKHSHTNEKITLSDEDYPFLLSNKAGEESVVRTFETRYNVEIRSNRKELTLVINGSPDGVTSARAAILGLLGGDLKFGAQIIDVHPLVLSAVIGKGGANISKMENEYGVKFDVLKTRNKLRILGDTDAKVLLARAAVETFMQNSRVTDSLTIPVPATATATATKKEVDSIVKRAADIYSIEITPASTTTDENATENQKQSTQCTFIIKGALKLVLEGKEFLSEQLSGRCAYTVPVLAHHVETLEKQVHGSLKRLQEKFSVDLHLDKPSKTSTTAPTQVRLEGPIDSVNAAKKDLIKLLERYFPNNFTFFELSGFCLRECFGEHFAAETAKLGVLTKIDRNQSFILLVGDGAALDAAKKSVEGAVAQWEDCHASIPIETSLVPALVGKAGASINALRKETKVSIDINATSTSVDIRGSSKAQVQEAKAAIEKRIKQLLAERWEVVAPVDFFPVLIGKQGANINKLRADTGANIDIDGGIIKVHGAEDKVAAAKAAILDLMQSSAAKVAGSKTLVMPSGSIPSIIGPKGATVRDIQDKTGVRFDFDRVKEKCAMKGSVEGVESAIKLVNEILAEEGYPPAHVEGNAPAPSAAAAAEPEQESSEEGADEVAPLPVKPKTLLGAAPGMLQKTAYDKNLSKSALKRLRRKQAQDEPASEPAVGAPAAAMQAFATEEDNGAESEEEPEVVAAPAAPVSGEKAAPVPVPAAAVQVPISVSTPQAVPVEASPVATSGPVSKLGVIGKGALKMEVPAPADTHSHSHTQQQNLSHQAPASAAPSLPLSQSQNPSLQHQYQQQHLINLLLGGDSKASIPNPSLYSANPSYMGAVDVSHQYQAQSHSHSQFLAPQPESSLYAQHNQGLYGGYQHSTSAPSSHLYAPEHQRYVQPAPAAPIRQQVNTSLASSAIVPPPGISPQGSANNSGFRQPGGLNIQTSGAVNFSAPVYSPPPPGLSPPGSSVTSSRFTFGDFAAAQASVSAPAPAPAYPSSYNYAPAPAAVPNMTYNPSLYSSVPAPAVHHNLNLGAAAPSANSAASNASGSSYYKSKSGFSVRL